MTRALSLRSLVLVVALSTVPAYAASTVSGGPLSQSQADQVASWIGGNFNFTDIFTGLDPFAFHAAADGKGRTLVVAEVVLGDRSRAWIGGYNPRSWSSSYDYNYSSTIRNAFVFNLTTPLKLAQNVGGAGDPGQYQAFNHPYLGPVFGAGKDIYLTSTDGTTVYPGGYAFNYSYGATNVFGTDYTEFETLSVDVYAVTSIPEPLSLTLLGLGLTAVAYLRMRRS